MYFFSSIIGKKRISYCNMEDIKGADMERRVLGKTGYLVSVISFGGIVVDEMPADEASKVVTQSIEEGINYFDVAPSYGKAQYILGPALEPHRKEVYLACKTGKRDAKGAKMELEESLKALRTDYFDNYQLHGLDDPKEIATVFAPGGAMETLRWAKEQGIVRKIGFTCHYDESALSIMEHAEFDTMLFPVNFAYCEQKNGSVSAIKTAREHDMGIIAIKALARRKWREGEEKTYPKCWYRPIYDDPTLARQALNYTLAQNVDTAVPPGDPRMLQLALDIIKNQKGSSVLLSEKDHAALMQAAQENQDIIF
jgi:predicted aldo/keto reductase-like oxidoreductase